MSKMNKERIEREKNRWVKFWSTTWVGRMRFFFYITVPPAAFGVGSNFLYFYACTPANEWLLTGTGLYVIFSSTSLSEMKISAYAEL